MTKKINNQVSISIRQRIYWSFSLIVCLFVINGIITIVTLNKNNNLSKHISTVIDPSIQSIEDFGDMLVASKMYTTNWVFLRSSDEDKDALKKLQSINYPEIQQRLKLLSSKWESKAERDSLKKIFTGFEQLLVFEKKIMSSLQKFEDYDDPVVKMEAERIVEDEILPRTSALISSLNKVDLKEQQIRTENSGNLERSSGHLRVMISALSITIICIGIFLSLYMARIIITPINKIRAIVNDLGKGIIQKINLPSDRNEIGQMINSINNLSEKLQVTAAFAHEIGARNFTIPFTPLSEQDTLGKALINMRDNLSADERQLTDANSEIRKSKANLELKNEELQIKNKELEQFVYIASHDMQEPLRTTTSFVDLLQQQYHGKLDERADKYLTYIVQSSDRMKTLIKDLLDYSRIGRKKEKEQVDCSLILKDVLADLQVAIKEANAQIDLPELPLISGYAGEIKQLFQNLVINAIKFRKKDTLPELKISVEKIKNYWQFAFKDNGIGIEEQHRDRVFLIFQRLHTRNEYEGSGIGLAHCKKIVESHGGKIWIESVAGEGTTFYFTILENTNL